MNNNFEYVDFPKLPQHVIDDIYETVNKNKLLNVPAGEKYPTWQSFRPSKKVRNYIMSILNAKEEQVLEHDIHISFLNGNLPKHNDTCRDTAFNYVIESGGKTLTNFWSDDLETMIESHHIEEHRWHRLNVKKQHSVDIEKNPRVIITVGSPWKNRVNTDLLTDAVVPNPGRFVDVYKKFCNLTKGTVFDFGTGDASRLLEFSKEFPELLITGIEGSHKLAKAAIENTNKTNISIQQKRFVEIIDSADCVISSYTLHHQHDANGNFWMPIKLIALRSKKPVHVCVIDYERPADVSNADSAISASYTKEEVEEQLSRMAVNGLTVSTEPISDSLNMLVIHGMIYEC